MRHFACFMKVDDCQAQNAILTIAFLAQLIIFLFFAPSGARPKWKVEASDVEIMGPKPRPGRDRDRRKVCLMGAFLAHRPLCDGHTPSSVFPSYFKSLWWLDIMTVGAIPPPSSCFFSWGDSFPAGENVREVSGGQRIHSGVVPRTLG